MKTILLLALLIPFFSFSQSTHYDSLYRAGVIDKGEYDILTKVKPIDSTQLKLEKYNGMLKAKLITPVEYNKLTHALLNAQPGDPNYNPNIDRANANSSTTAGVVAMILGTVCAGVGIGTHINHGGSYPLSVATGSLGGISLCFGLGLLIHGGTLRHRANINSTH